MLDLATAKAFLRVQYDDEDAAIARMLASAIAQVERMTGHLLTPKTVTEPVSMRRMAERGGIRLFKAPVTAVTGVTYLDGGFDPDANTVAIDSFQLVEGAEARLLPGWGEAWPALDVGQVLTVTYEAGYADGEVPPELEEAVLKLTDHAFVHRGDDDAKAPDLDHLIGPYRPIGIG